MYLLLLSPTVQMKKQTFTEVKHCYKLQGYFNRIQRNKAIMKRVPFVFKRLCLIPYHTPKVTLHSTCSYEGHSQGLLLGLKEGSVIVLECHKQLGSGYSK